MLALVSFRVLIPVACALYAWGVWRGSPESRLFSTSARMALLSVVLVLVVPVSAQVSQIIDETFETSLVVSEESIVEQNKAAETVAQEASAEEKSLWESLADFVGGAVDSVSGAAANAANRATAALGNLLEAFAVMIITSCVVPILVVVLALWLVNLILGIDTSGAMAALKGRAWRAPMREKRNKLAGAVKARGAAGGTDAK